MKRKITDIERSLAQQDQWPKTIGEFLKILRKSDQRKKELLEKLEQAKKHKNTHHGI